MNNYVIKDSKKIHELTGICRIGIVKREGNEWSTFVKKINVDTVPDFAAVRFDSQGVCGVFVNGRHIEGNTGRYPNRITYVECTSALVPGENEIKIVLGGHYYQTIRDKIRARAGALFSCVAAQLLLEKDGKTTEYVTDESWACISDDGQTTPTCYSEVTRAEYDRFWLSAALVPEYSPISCPKAITDVVGAQYQAYISGSKLDFAYPEKVVATNMSSDGHTLNSNEDTSSCRPRDRKRQTRIYLSNTQRNGNGYSNTKGRHRNDPPILILNFLCKREGECSHTYESTPFFIKRTWRTLLQQAQVL